MMAKTKVKREAFLQQLSSWYQRYPGKTLYRLESSHLNRILEDRFGYYLLQLGGYEPVNWLSKSKISRQICLSPDAALFRSKPCIQAHYDELPVLTDSVDVVVLKHVLEYAPHPEKILYEAWRIVIPEGTIVLMAFNPYSLWGIWRLLRGKKKGIPWGGHFYSGSKWRRSLLNLGCDILEYQTIYFNLPAKHKRTLERWKFLEALGPLLWPFGGAVYVLVAKKQMSPLTRIRASVKKNKNVLRDPVAEPVARSHDHA